MDTIIDRIRTNDPTFKDLILDQIGPDPADQDVDSEDVCQTMISALACNDIVERVHLGSDFFAHLIGAQGDDNKNINHAANVTDLFGALGRLPSLEHVYIRDMVQAQQPLRVEHLAALVRHARRLVVLDVREVDLQGNQNDFTALKESLDGHPALETFLLKDFVVVDEDQFCFDHVVRVLGTIPTLTHVELESRKVGHGFFSGRCLNGLLTANEKLEHLHICRFHLDHLSVNRIAHGVKYMSTLQSLSLPSTGLDNLGVIKLATALKRRVSCCCDTGNRRGLKLLNLSFNEFDRKGCAALAEALKVYSSFGAVTLDGNKNSGAAGWEAMATTADTLENKERAECSLDEPLHHGQKGKYEHHKQQQQQQSLKELLYQGNIYRMALVTEQS